MTTNLVIDDLLLSEALEGYIARRKRLKALESFGSLDPYFSLKNQVSMRN